jgi:hypothetical protein
MVLNEIKKILMCERCYLGIFYSLSGDFVGNLESAALNPSTSPDLATFTNNVLPSCEERVSLTRPLQTTDTIRGIWPSVNKMLPVGNTA